MLDIPLLLETAPNPDVDVVLVVSTSKANQRARLRNRGRMTEAEIEAIIARQMPDSEKRRRADVLVRTGLSRRHAQARIARLIQELRRMTRSVLFDTETTGLEPRDGHRVIEVAALELINELPTGRQFHCLINPERDIPEDATRVHGFTIEHLRDKPLFRAIADELIAFLGPDDMLVAHNAPFDFRFLNAEFARCGLPALAPQRMVDTLDLAKARFPGMPNSLDALCRRFGIDLSERGSHNALLDCRLLAEVYIELTGGRQRGLSLAVDESTSTVAQYEARSERMLRPVMVSAAEEERHAQFIQRLKNPIWLREAEDAGKATAAG